MKGPSLKKTRLSPAAAKEVAQFEQEWNLAKQKNYFSFKQFHWTPRLLTALAKGAIPQLPLKEIGRRIIRLDKPLFWSFVFENASVISRQALFEIWQGCLSYGGHPFFFFNEAETAAVYGNPKLLDCDVISKQYCLDKHPGWEMLRHINGLRRITPLHLSPGVIQSLQEDNAPAFAIHSQMSGQKLSFSLLMEIFQKKAFHIFRHLLENGKITDQIISLPELCCLLAVQMPDEISVPALAFIEETHPGLVKDVHDVFGRNLLWYALHNQKTGWFHPDCRLTPFLLKCGCDPQNPTTVGLTWQEVTASLSLEQKMALMGKRYSIAREGSDLIRQQSVDTIQQEYDIRRLETELATAPKLRDASVCQNCQHFLHEDGLCCCTNHPHGFGHPWSSNTRYRVPVHLFEKVHVLFLKECSQTQRQESAEAHQQECDIRRLETELATKPQLRDASVCQNCKFFSQNDGLYYCSNHPFGHPWSSDTRYRLPAHLFEKVHVLFMRKCSQTQRQESTEALQQECDIRRLETQ